MPGRRAAIGLWRAGLVLKPQSVRLAGARWPHRPVPSQVRSAGGISVAGHMAGLLAVVGWIARCGDDVFMQKFRAKAIPDACIGLTPVALSRRGFSSFEALL